LYLKKGDRREGKNKRNYGKETNSKLDTTALEELCQHLRERMLQVLAIAMRGKAQGLSG
jgi:hypothetical protein